GPPRPWRPCPSGRPRRPRGPPGRSRRGRPARPAPPPSREEGCGACSSRSRSGGGGGRGGGRGGGGAAGWSATRGGTAAPRAAAGPVARPEGQPAPKPDEKPKPAAADPVRHLALDRQATPLPLDLGGKREVKRLADAAALKALAGDKAGEALARQVDFDKE